MARYIDVEGYRKLFDEEYKKTRKLISEGETHLDNLAEGFSEASRVIDRMPTADVVEVIRCKDCKNSFIGRNGKLMCDILYPSLSWVDNDGFCNHGERKD